MKFLSKNNLITLIISVIIVSCIAVTATLSWFFFTPKNEVTANDISVLYFDFTSDKKFNQDYTLNLNALNTAGLTPDTYSNYESLSIAPGTKGYHTFTFSNKNSEVPVKYSVSIDLTNSTYPTNMKFFKSYSANLSDYSSTASFYTTNLISSNQTIWSNVTVAAGAESTQNFSFYWPFDNGTTGNQQDLDFLNSGKGINIKFNIYAYQDL